MANVGDLEVFRQKWREELNKKKSVEREVDDGEGSSIPLSSKNQNVTTSTNSVNIKFNDNIICSSSKVDNFNKPEVAYYPFDIVCNLLKFDKKNQLEHDEDSDIIPVVKYSLKRQRDQQPKNNTTKKVKLKDIFSDRGNHNGLATERILDKFISDLDEINEIPFFDISIPREVAVKIFQHLSMLDLCRCAQVSKSWKSLAEDELLWCKICHELGCEEDTLAVERIDWKNIVRQSVSHKKLVLSNWK